MDMRKQYDENGYILVRNFFTLDEVLALTYHVDSVYQPWVEQNRTTIIAERLVNMHSLTHKRYFKNNLGQRVKFFETLTPLKLTEFVQRIFGDDIYFHNTQLFFSPSNKKRHPYWHRDLQYSVLPDEEQKREQQHMLTLHIRIPLIKEQGIELIPGSHKTWDTDLQHNVRFEKQGHSSEETLANSTSIGLDVGDILLFNAQMLHRGIYKNHSSRKALDLCIGNYHPLTAPFLDKDILPNNGELNNIKNNSWYVKALNIADNDLPL
ncbi:phytanoyl-CoA dioxygenase family protein [Colwelliaceae bacterium 6471]